MNEEKAREVLKDIIQMAWHEEYLDGYFDSDDDAKVVTLFNDSVGVYLDGDYSLEQLSALVWWMENKND